VQFRLLEFLLGNKDASYLAVFEHDPAALERLRAALEAPSIYDEFLRLLARRGLPVPPERVERDWSEPVESHPASWRSSRIIYEDTGITGTPTTCARSWWTWKSISSSGASVT
jgi:tryptophan 2,3-dioxygenase